MAKTDCFGERLVQAQRGGHRPADLGHLQRMGETGNKVVTVRVDEHLGLVLEPPEGLGVEDPVPVPLESGAVGIWFLFVFTALGGRREGCCSGKQVALLLFADLPGTPFH